MNTTARRLVTSNYNAQSIALSDEVLFTEMCTLGSEMAFNQLFDKYYSMLLSYAMTISKCEMDAEEIVNDVFYKFWTSKDKINHYLNVKYYLKISVRNKAIDLIRKNNKSKSKVISQTNEELSMINCNYTGYNALDDICSVEVCSSIDKVVNRIPPKARKIFMMSRFEGMKYKEIAENLNISVKTVETQMTRSLSSIRKELKCIDFD